MTDELERIRALHDAAPGPSREWVDDTRAELLAMAAEETAATETPVAEGLLSRLRRRAAEVVDATPPLAWAGAAAAMVVAIAAVTVLGRAPSEAPPVARPTGTPAPTTPAPATPGDTVVLASSCTGPDGAYTVGYPEGWHTNTGDVAAPCQWFGQEPVAVEEGTGGPPSTPVVVRVLPVPFDRAVEPGRETRELARQSTTVAGRDAVRIDRESTGVAALPEGVRIHQWFVDLDEQRTLMLAAYSGIGSADFDHYRQVVDEMARSLELPPAD